MKTILIHTTKTKRDTWGNVYSVDKVTHPKTGRSFTVHEGLHTNNILSIVRDAFGGWDKIQIYHTEESTNSSRTSSLPATNTVFANTCSFDKHWARALRQIGFSSVRNPR